MEMDLCQSLGLGGVDSTGCVAVSKEYNRFCNIFSTFFMLKHFLQMFQDCRNNHQYSNGVCVKNPPPTATFSGENTLGGYYCVCNFNAYP